LAFFFVVLHHDSLLLFHQLGRLLFSMTAYFFLKEKVRCREKVTGRRHSGFPLMSQILSDPFSPIWERILGSTFFRSIEVQKEKNVGTVGTKRAQWKIRLHTNCKSAYSVMSRSFLFSKRNNGLLDWQTIVHKSLFPRLQFQFEEWGYNRSPVLAYLPKYRFQNNEENILDCSTTLPDSLRSE